MVRRGRPTGKANREDSIAKFLEAAEKLFIENGFAKTTMADVVHEAGSSIGNLYFYFSNKEELLQKLVEDQLLAAHAQSDAITSEVPAGPGKMATMTFSTAGLLLAPGAPLGKLLRHSAGHPVAQRVFDLNAARVRGYINENFPNLAPEEREYAHVIWSAAGIAVAQQMASEDGDVWAPIEFFVRWNLRGLRVSEVEIDRAIEVAYGAMKR